MSGLLGAADTDNDGSVVLVYGGVRLLREFDGRTFAAVELQAESHLLRLQPRSMANAELRAELAARLFILFGAQF